MLDLVKDDREEALLITVERFCLVEALDAAVEPALGHLQTLLRIHEVALSGRTLIESHHDVGTDDAFCIHHVLWSVAHVVDELGANHDLIAFLQRHIALLPNCGFIISAINSVTALGV